MNNQVEREQFSERLSVALETAGFQSNSATRLAELFNSVSSEGVSIHAARKWLIGQAIPTQNKIRVLAQMLNVEPEWLRFGTPAQNPTPEPQATDLLTASLLHNFTRLDEKHKKVAVQMLRILVELD
ncbi:hypothetical protein SAMN06265795_12660 [Noviherbaspirillum humi]|uniref:HTH cro/C1-type domain-containing protein n=1 Tax=Noviherbaspirillum humi TaxID=1688639 RepID=A0A239LVM9_9BURK|nr:hypothetical protein [Noviherbaspirillum humi]SNT33928.1 hypothetical protein SAMN06265795_12660 [Noviherbaspirillum humi]